MVNGWVALEQQWRRSLWRTRPSKFSPVFSDEDILQAAHDGNARCLEMIEFNREWPSRRHWHHQVHSDFNLPCDSYCAPRANGNHGNIIQRIKAKFRIEEIAEKHTSLRGFDPMTGPCFLHSGSGSEFAIWVDEQKWKCFGQCGIGGDVIDLVRAMEERGMEWDTTNHATSSSARTI